MPSVSDFPARGKVTAVAPDRVTFVPSGTNYELHLMSGADTYTGSLNTPVEFVIRVQARKLWTVPSGGGFISPIFGTPRIIQGRVKYVDAKEMVVLAGTHFVVTLPPKDDAYDLVRGDIAVGSLVNVVALPGVRFEQVVPVAAVK